jgi:hypothetical protein
MSLSEFPRQPDDVAVVRLANAILAHGTPASVAARQLDLVSTYGVSAGFSCATQRAKENLGAFLSDVLLSQRALSAAELRLAFLPWLSATADEGAVLQEYGGDSAEWLLERMSHLAVLLGGEDPCVNAPVEHREIRVLENPPQRPL